MCRAGGLLLLGRPRREDDDEAEPRHAYPAHLPSGAGRRRDALSDRTGARPRARERGPVVGTVNAGVDRNAIGAHGGSYALYRALAVSSGALEPDRAAGPHQHGAGGRDRPAPAMVGAGPHRLARSLGPPHRRGFPHRDRRGRRHPPEHRDHQGAADHFGAGRGGRARPAQGRRHDHEGHRRSRGHQGRGRAGLVSARHRGALRRRGGCAAPHAVRADRRHVSGARHAAGSLGVPAADRRHHALHLRRSRGRVGQAPHARLPRARRVQRLGRVRLRHLHLPALSHPRHRGVHQRGAERRRAASSSTTARKAARSAR